jgi:hypothetical protein
MTSENHARAIALSVPILLTLFLAVQLTSCRSLRQTSQPTIEFTKVPPAAQGGRERTDTISGRVTNSRPGQKIVVFAQSGPWWVQPWPDQALLPIQPDGTFTTSTHLGFKYAALLVDPSYHPPSTMDLDPSQTNAILAVKIVPGVGPAQIAPTVPLHFSGYDWLVRTIAADIGGVNNLFDPDNAWTDSSGALHLRIHKKNDRWSCAHLTLSRSLGYGTYIFHVRDTAHLEPAAVLSLTTFDDWGAVEHYREMDIETSQWGDAANKYNAQFAIQPFYVPGNVSPFATPAGPVTYSLHWESGKATFRAVRGSSATPASPVALIFEHVFTTGVPAPGQEKILFMFYVVASDHSPLQHENEVVIDKFEYLP